MSEFYYNDPTTGTTQDKLYISGVTYVINLDFIPLDQVFVSLNGVDLTPETNFYIFQNNQLAIRNITGLTSNDIINVFYQNKIPLIGETFTKEPTVSFYIDNPINYSGTTLFILKDVTGGTISVKETNWDVNNNTKKIIINDIPTYGTYYYEIKNKEGFVLITGEVVYTESTTGDIKFTISSDTFNKLI